MCCGSTRGCGKWQYPLSGVHRRNSMIKINQVTCVGCGDCIKDCLAGNLFLADGHAKAYGDCINCGHCVAICPAAAVSIPDYTMEDVMEYQKESFDIPADTLLHFIKFRRSIRQFQVRPIEDEKIKQIIEAGRYIPTGGNRQNVRFIVVKEQLQPLRGYILKRLASLATESDGGAFATQYGARFGTMYESYLKDPLGEDKLFFHAPVVLLVVSKDTLPAALASTGMELMANALGVGCLYSGFSTFAINSDVNCRTLLNISEQENAVTALVLGYANVQYLRTAPRKPPEVITL